MSRESQGQASTHKSLCDSHDFSMFHTNSMPGMYFLSGALKIVIPILILKKNGKVTHIRPAFLLVTIINSGQNTV